MLSPSSDCPGTAHRTRTNRARGIPAKNCTAPGSRVGGCTRATRPAESDLAAGKDVFVPRVFELGFRFLQKRENMPLECYLTRAPSAVARGLGTWEPRCAWPGSLQTRASGCHSVLGRAGLRSQLGRRVWESPTRPLGWGPKTLSPRGGVLAAISRNGSSAVTWASPGLVLEIK